MELSRRTFIGSLTAGLAGAAAGTGLVGRQKSVKNVIFCVADGMAVSVPTIVDGLSRASTGKPSYWCSLMNERYATTGLQHTRSLSCVVTDSSAASSAWGCGRRIWNGQVNMYPDGTALKTLGQIVKEKGMRVGLVTTTTVTHATPAGFVASVASRGNEAAIAVQYLERDVDVILGGGDRVFSPEKRPDKRDLYADFAEKGYVIVKDKATLASTRARRLLGVFSDGHMPYSVDRANNTDLMVKVPTLAAMTKSAIECLNGSRDGFLLQIEGGKVDHAGHAADIVGMVNDQIAFEEAVRVAVEFALQDGETLVIVTSDHATGGPSLNGSGSGYFDANAGMESILEGKASFDIAVPAIGALKTSSSVRDYVKQTYSYEITEAEGDLLARREVASRPSEFDRSLNMLLSDVLGNYSKSTFTSLNHTSDHVLVTAVGPGSEQFGGLTENTRFFDAILALRGWSYSNPTMTFEEAARHRDRLQAIFKADKDRFAHEGEPVSHWLV